MPPIKIDHRLTFLLIGLLLTACSSLNAAPTPTPIDGLQSIDPPLALADFTLTDQHGAPTHLSDLKGKLVLATFGYTHCPDICPENLANFKQIKQFLGDDAARVAFVFASVDGGRDTPAVLTKYLAAFDSSFIGWTGSDTAIQPVAQAFGVAYFIDSATSDPKNYTMTHTSSTFLVDGRGRLRRVYAFDLKPQVVAADMRQVLKQDGG